MDLLIIISSVYCAMYHSKSQDKHATKTQNIMCDVSYANPLQNICFSDSSGIFKGGNSLVLYKTCVFKQQTGDNIEKSVINTDIIDTNIIDKMPACDNLGSQIKNTATTQNQNTLNNSENNTQIAKEWELIDLVSDDDMEVDNSLNLVPTNTQVVDQNKPMGTLKDLDYKFTNAASVSNTPVNIPDNIFDIKVNQLPTDTSIIIQPADKSNSLSCVYQALPSVIRPENFHKILNTCDNTYKENIFKVLVKQKFQLYRQKSLVDEIPRTITQQITVENQAEVDSVQKPETQPSDVQATDAQVDQQSQTAPPVSRQNSLEFKFGELEFSKPKEVIHHRGADPDSHVKFSLQKRSSTELSDNLEKYKSKIAKDKTVGLDAKSSVFSIEIDQISSDWQKPSSNIEMSVELIKNTITSLCIDRITIYEKDTFASALLGTDISNVMYNYKFWQFYIALHFHLMQHINNILQINILIIDFCKEWCGKKHKGISTIDDASKIAFVAKLKVFIDQVTYTVSIMESKIKGLGSDIDSQYINLYLEDNVFYDEVEIYCGVIDEFVKMEGLVSKRYNFTKEYLNRITFLWNDVKRSLNE